MEKPFPVFGRGFTCSASWRVPENLKGKFTAKVDYKIDPFEVINKPATFTIR